MKARIVLLTYAIAVCCAADVSWDTDHIVTAADPSADSTTAVFTASAVGGPARVRVSQLGCGCMTANREWQAIAPEAKVPVTIVFSHGSRSGKQTKRIGVECDVDGKTTTKQLLLEVTIPEVISFDKRILSWGVGESQAQQVVLGRVAGPPMKILEARTDSPLIQASIATAEGGDRWTITVTPQEGFVGHGRVELITDHPYERYKRITLHAMHRTPAPDVSTKQGSPSVPDLGIVVWDSTKVSVDAMPGVDRVEAQVRVTNTTSRNIVLSRLVNRAGQMMCTEMPITLAPQAAQTLDIVCELPGSSGLRTFRAEVVLKDGAQELAQPISITVKTGERVQFRTRSLAWTKQAAEYAEKRIVFSSVDGVTGIIAVSQDPRYTYRLVPDAGGEAPKDGKPLLQGAIVIKPNAGVEPHTVVLKAITNAPDASSKELSIRMVVQ